MESLVNKNTKKKMKEDVKSLETFLKNEKSDEREVQVMSDEREVPL